jgi:hypothetical protein
VVFLVTDSVIVGSEDEVTREEAVAWISEGGDRLPPALGANLYTKAYTCSARIYEFYQESPNSEPKQSVPSLLAAREHLERSNLWKELSK